MTTPMTTSAAAAPHQTEDGRLALQFKGDTREYFRIWAVNLCLTLLTLGIFSAWAKVRKKRYFYSNTVLDGTAFQYLGQPLPILKGRVIAAILFLVYYASSHIFTSLLPYTLAAALIVAPWVVVRSAAFTARYSAYRNITFGFDGNYVDALRTIYAWGLIPVLVTGSMFEWWGNLYVGGALFLVFGLAFPLWLCRLKSFLIAGTRYGGARGTLGATGTEFFKVYFVAGLIVMAFAFVTGFAFAMLMSPAGRASTHWILLGSVPVYIGYVLAFAYVKANIANLVWTSTRLGPITFRSTQSGTELVKLYVTNALAIVATLGLATPWAVIRTFKYRAENMHIFAPDGLDSLRGDMKSTVQASGAEVAEFFDLDLSL